MGRGGTAWERRCPHPLRRGSSSVRSVLSVVSVLFPRRLKPTADTAQSRPPPTRSSPPANGRRLGAPTSPSASGRSTGVSPVNRRCRV